ncbi:uncharacterized protein LOC141854691 [Brevipalpus obovatus]|uniref:uncharacterized protein LOC141854691 n=1 Tax=Brevipalpus obovatus TaxID=246614 RepID=UPI003D9DB86B
MEMNKVAFFCRDGFCHGNALILANHSRILSEAFLTCPGKPAIKLPNIALRDVKCLFNVLNSLSYAEISNARLTGLQNVARLLDIELTLQNGRNGFVRVMASSLSMKKDSSSVSSCNSSRPNASAIIRTSFNETSTYAASDRTSANTRSHSIDSMKQTDCSPASKIDPDGPKHTRQSSDSEQPSDPLNPSCSESVSLSNGDRQSVALSTDLNLDIDMDDLDDDVSVNVRCSDEELLSQLKLKRSSKGKHRLSTKKHYTKTNRKEEYTCNLCKHVVNSWFGIKTHIETDHFHLEFVCKKCGFLSIYRAEIMKHLRSFHKTKSNENLYVTRQVSKKSRADEEMVKEAKTEQVDTPEEPPPVESGDQSQRSAQSIQDQSDDSIEEKKIITPVKPFERLSARFPDINKDCYEMVKNGQKKAYQCLKCDKQCRTYCGIREHHYSQHHHFICICNHCDVKYRSRSNMFKHLSIAHQIAKNFTSHFGYFIEEGHQNSAEAPQETTPPSQSSYKCRICSLQFADKDTTTNHLIYKHRIKSDVSPFLEEISEQA